MNLQSEAAIGIEDLNDALNYVFPYLDNKSLSQLRTTSHFFQASTRKELIRRLELKLESIEVIVGEWQSYFIIGGRVWFCGTNFPNQLEYPDKFKINPHTFIPTLIPNLENVKTIAVAGDSFLIILKNNGTVWERDNKDLCEVKIDGEFSFFKLKEIPGLGDVKAISTSETHSIFLKKDGTVWVRGDNNAGELGLDDNKNRLIPEEIPGVTNVKEAIARNSYSIFLKEDGTVWVCGDNKNQQLGLSVGDVILKPQKIPNLENVKAIGGKDGRNVFLKEEGTVWICGNNIDGQLGLGHRNLVSIPEQIPGLIDVKAFMAEKNYNFFLKENGTVWVLGNPTQGLKVEQHRHCVDCIPEQIPGLTGIKVIAGSSFIAVLYKEDGSFYSFGHGLYGELGLGKDTQVTSLPMKITTLTCEKTVSLLQKLKEEEKVETIRLQNLQSSGYVNTDGQYSNKRKRDEDNKDNEDNSAAKYAF